MLRPAIHRQEAQRETFRLGQYRSARWVPLRADERQGVMGVRMTPAISGTRP